MKIYFRIPKEQPWKYFFHFSIIFFLVFSFSIFEKLNRSELDIPEAKSFCGHIYSYHFSKPSRSFATWRLKVVSESGKNKVFEIGAKYIQEKSPEIYFTKGKEVCVKYLIINYVFFDHFITQISTTNGLLLETDEVINSYLKTPSSLELYTTMAFLIMSLSLLIKIQRCPNNTNL